MLTITSVLLHHYYILLLLYCYSYNYCSIQYQPHSRLGQQGIEKAGRRLKQETITTSRGAWYTSTLVSPGVLTLCTTLDRLPRRIIVYDMISFITARSHHHRVPDRAHSPLSTAQVVLTDTEKLVLGCSYLSLSATICHAVSAWKQQDKAEDNVWCTTHL